MPWAEYIWVDGSTPVQKLRSKSLYVRDIDDIRQWSFDGSSTGQATGDLSDCLLEPECIVDDPSNPGSYLVLCEVMTLDGEPHATNTRARLRAVLENGGAELSSLWGFEQEYVLMRDNRILGWPTRGFPSPQGPYYCGVGADEVIGRKLVEEHKHACEIAGLLIYGINAEVMLGQWEFQIGYRGYDDDVTAGPLIVSDHLWLARWLLYRIGEKHNISATLDPKPRTGDWNGSGCHTNFSTAAMRSKEHGPGALALVFDALEQEHLEHQAVYGHGNRLRLTGMHETCAYNEFRVGSSDRGASIRVPPGTDEKGYGYLEDRRPAANCDPYLVSARILWTIVQHSLQT